MHNPSWNRWPSRDQNGELAVSVPFPGASEENLTFISATARRALDSSAGPSGAGLSGFPDRRWLFGRAAFAAGGVLPRAGCGPGTAVWSFRYRASILTDRAAAPSAAHEALAQTTELGDRHHRG